MRPRPRRPLILLGDPDAVRAVYRGERQVHVRELAPTRSGRPRKARAAAAHIELSPDGLYLFEALRGWRREESSRQGLPPYVIFHDKTLQEIARARPATLDALAGIGGVGASKLERYGDAVLRVVRMA